MTAALVPGIATASFANELPRVAVVISFHPRADQPFTLDQLRRALRAGVHGVELDLRWRATDSAVVCVHDARDLAARPTFEAALDAILHFQGSSRSVQRDRRQFYITLDLKQEGDAYHRAILKALRDRAEHWSTSARPGQDARGITVVVSGSRAALERSAPATSVDSLCLVEGEDATNRKRILDLSDRDGPLAWVALQYPVTRERIRAIHEGRDAQYGGRFNVRVYGAGRQLAQAVSMGADAVNADFTEIAGARTAAKAAATAAAKARARTETGADRPAGFCTLQGWKVDPRSRAEFETAWRKHANSRRARVAGWRSTLLLRSQTDPGVYRVVDRWEDRASWRRFAKSEGALADSTLGEQLPVRASAPTTQEMVELEDRFGERSVAGDHIRFYYITTRARTARFFPRAWRRANDAIRAAHHDALGASLAWEPGRPSRFLEIVRWKSEEAWRRIAAAPPPDPDADLAIHAATSDIVTERYVAIESVR